MLAAPPVLPGGGRAFGAAWKDFESSRFSMVLPPASRRGAASLRWPRQPVIHRSEGEFAVAEIFLPALTESGPAFDRMRSCALRLAAAFGQPCGFYGGAGARHCASRGRRVRSGAVRWCFCVPQGRPQCIEDSGIQDFPSRSVREGQHSLECVLVRCGWRGGAGAVGSAARPGRTGAAPLARRGRILNRTFHSRFCRLLRGES